MLGGDNIVFCDRNPNIGRQMTYEKKNTCHCFTSTWLQFHNIYLRNGYTELKLVITIALITTHTLSTCKAQVHFSQYTKFLQFQHHIIHSPVPLSMFSCAIWCGQCQWATKPIPIWIMYFKARFDKLSQERGWLDKSRFHFTFHKWIKTVKLTESWKLGLWILHM